MKHLLDIVVNAEGDHLAYLSSDGGETAYRIAGPKAWGGSKHIVTLEIRSSDLARYIKAYAPDVLQILKERDHER